jgi:CRP-like cAMP-binding protein
MDFETAKDEIISIRNYAKQFLDSMSALDGSIVGDEAFKESHRGALYDKQDFSSFRSTSYPKSDEVKAFIYDAIRPNALFENDGESELIELINLFKPVTKKKGERVVEQGEKGDTFYVVESGELSIQIKTGKGKDAKTMKCGQYSTGAAFGELALIFDSPRAATITATTNVKLWCLERQAYRLRIGQIRFQEREEKLNFIRRCKIRGRDFCELFDASQIEDLSCVVKTDHYKEGSVVLREGEVNDTLYIIRSGTVDRFKRTQDGKIGSVREGQTFGTYALLTVTTSTETFVAATDIVVYYLTHNDFESMIGTMQDALDGRSITRSMMRSSSRHTFKTSMTMDQRYTNLTLDDLTFFNVLGRGAFGKVILVQSKSNKKVFALKAQSKHFILKKGQTEHVLNEYRLMKKLDHPSVLNVSRFKYNYTLFFDMSN